MQLFGFSQNGVDYITFWSAFSAISTFLAFLAAGGAFFVARRQLKYQSLHNVRSTLAQISIRPQTPNLTFTEWDGSTTRNYENWLTEPESMLTVKSNPDASYVHADHEVLEAYSPYAAFPHHPVFIFDTPLKITNYSSVSCAISISIDSSKISKIINDDSYEARSYPTFIVGDDESSHDLDQLQPILLGKEQSVIVILRRLVFPKQLLNGTIDKNGSFKLKPIAISDERYSNFMEPMELKFEVNNLTDNGKRVYQFLEDTQWNYQKLAKGIHFLGLGVQHFRLTHVEDIIKTPQMKNWKHEKITNPSTPQQPKNFKLVNHHITI